MVADVGSNVCMTMHSVSEASRRVQEARPEIMDTYTFGPVFASIWSRACCIYRTCQQRISAGERQA